jgi:F0F1-type ATP synthase membrane subunit b/b'
MGKKLSSWEKAAGERQREREAAERRAKTAARKDREKAGKEREKELNAKLGSTYAKLFDELYDRLTNLTSSDRAKEINAQQAIKIPSKLKELRSLVDLSYQSVSSEFTQKAFFKSELLRDAESEKNMDFATYKNKYGSFFSNLFGSTTKKYQEFIIEATRKVQDALAKDEERKKKFHEALLEYEDAIINHNKIAKTKLSQVNKKRNEIFVQLNNDIKSLNKEIESISQNIELAFKNYIHSDFVNLIGLNLPLQFPDLDEVANNLISDISEIDKTFYDSPSNGFEYGLTKNENDIILYVKYSKDYFPFPSRLQINETAQSFSVTSLTKNRIKQIDDNLVAGIVLCYIAYIFNSVQEVNELTIYTVKDDIDDATGKPVLNPEQGLKVTRSQFFDLQFDRLVPFQTIKSFSFKVDKDIELENIIWFKKGKSENVFFKKIRLINDAIVNIKNTIALILNEKFKYPLDDSIIKARGNIEKYLNVNGPKSKQTQTRKKTDQ